MVIDMGGARDVGGAWSELGHDQRLGRGMVRDVGGRGQS